MSEKPFVRNGQVDPVFMSGLHRLSAVSPSSGFGVVLVTSDGQAHRFANAHMPSPQSEGGDFPAGRVIAAFENGDVFRRAEILVHDRSDADQGPEAEMELVEAALAFLSDIETLAAGSTDAGEQIETGAAPLSNAV